MFYAFASLLIIIVSLINNCSTKKSAIFSSFIPLFYIALLYFCYTYFIPILYNLFVNYVDPTNYGYIYLMVYGYPVLDLILYIVLLVFNAKCGISMLEAGKNVMSIIQYFILGYFIGITMLVGIT
jgi:hypothetical protein